MQESGEVLNTQTAHEIEQNAPQKHEAEEEINEETRGDNEAKELNTLREAYASLKEELELLKHPEEDNARMRTIGLRILQDRIESVLGEGKIDMLNSRLAKAENALEEERYRSTELESKLKEHILKEKKEMSTEDRLKQVVRNISTLNINNLLKSDKELEDLKSSYHVLKLQLEVADAQLKEQLDCESSLKDSFHHEKQKVEELRTEINTLKLEKSQEIAELRVVLEDSQVQQKKAEERVIHLERLLLKLTEDSAPEEENLDEIEEVLESTIPKQSISFPDPPSVEESPRENAADQASIKQTVEKDTGQPFTGEIKSTSENQQELLSTEEQIHSREVDIISSETGHGDQIAKAPESTFHVEEPRNVRGSGGWGVSGFWSFVTGESSQ